MSKVFIEETTLTAIGDAIREKTSSEDLIAPLDMATAISNLSSGGGTLKMKVITCGSKSINISKHTSNLDSFILFGSAMGDGSYFKFIFTPIDDIGFLGLNNNSSDLYGIKGIKTPAMSNTNYLASALSAPVVTYEEGIIKIPSTTSSHKFGSSGLLFYIE